MTMELAAAAAKPLIDWASLGKVAIVSAAFGIGIVAVFSIGMLGLAQIQAETSASRRPAALATAVACFGLCIAAVLYGLWLIVPQFHGQ